MAVNKNFVIRNGLEVNTNLILADADLGKVGIGSTVPRFELDVAGGIGATDVYVSGVATFISDIKVGSDGSVLSVVGAARSVGVGTEIPAYLLDVRSATSTGTTALYVQGDVRITGDLSVDDINFDQADINSLNVVGIATIGSLGVIGLTTSKNLIVSGVSTFSDYIDINDDVNISGTLSVGGATTIGGYLDVNAAADFSSNVIISGFSTFGSRVDINDSVDISSNLNVSGIGTIGIVKISSGIITATSGIVTYYGDGSGLTGLLAGIELQEDGVLSGTAVTAINFTGTAVTSIVVTPGVGIATITLNAGAGGGGTPGGSDGQVQYNNAGSFGGSANFTFDGSNVNIAGVTTASSFSGSGASLTSLNASNISSGTLAIARGGTNGSATPSAGAIAYGNGSAYAFNSPGSSSQVLLSGGTGAPTWTNQSSLSVGSATNATNATNVAITNNTSTNATYYVHFGSATSGNDGVEVDSSTFTYNPSTNTLTAGTFSGNLSGNATSATYATTAGIATNVVGGIASVTSLSVSGISTLGTLEISSGIVTATSGIITYYGDGSNLTGIAGGGSGEFNTGISSSVQLTPLSYETSIYTFPSTAGKQYVIESINVANVDTSVGVGTTVNIIASIENSSGEQTYIAYNVPITNGGLIELLKNPIVAGPSDVMKMWATNGNYFGVSNATEVYMNYAEFDSTEYISEYASTVSIATTDSTAVYTSTTYPTTIEAIHLANRTDTGDYPVSVSITNGVTTTYLAKNLIIPRYATVDILDRPKRVEASGTVNIEVGQTSTIDVIIAGKQITS
jgi:hypothetical protein